MSRGSVGSIASASREGASSPAIANGGDQGDHQRGAQGTRIAPRQAGPRQADAQPAHRAHRARDMRLPKRDRRRIGSAGCRATAGRSAPRAAGGTGRRRPPGGDRPPCRPARRWSAEPADQQPKDQQRGDGEQPDMPPGRQQARQVEQCGADEQRRQRQAEATAPARCVRTGWRSGPARGGRQAGATGDRTLRPGRLISSQCGTRSPRHKSAWLSRSRITDQSLPSTITSAATGRALYAELITEP